MKSRSHPIPVILVISREITPRFDNFSLKITKKRETCHSRISWFLQMVNREFTLTLDSRKFCSRPITSKRCIFGPQIQSCLCNKLAGCSCGLWLLQFVNNLQCFPQQLYLGQNCFENGKFYEKSSDVSASSIW